MSNLDEPTLTLIETASYEMAACWAAMTRSLADAAVRPQAEETIAKMATSVFINLQQQKEAKAREARCACSGQNGGYQRASEMPKGQPSGEKKEPVHDGPAFDPTSKVWRFCPTCGTQAIVHESKNRPGTTWVGCKKCKQFLKKDGTVEAFKPMN